tara:strand:+ start:6804 stop:8414 length:1611 start_codon:yes stop_codon:yes gene_type:complete
MGILRADRVSGLGGANAINGSLKFASDAGAGQGTYLEVYDPDDDLKFGTSDWTIEFWMYANTIDTSEQENDLASILDFGYGSSNNATGAWFAVHQEDATLHLGFNNANQVQSSNFLSANTWHHIAITRTSNTAKIYGDGTQVATVSCSQDFTDVIWRLLQIGSQAATGVERNFDGYISNLRIIKGTALYTAAFTPPTTRLEKTSDTVLLCCQSPGNAFKEETGKSIVLGTLSKTPGPTASHFVPDVGEDHGTTFTDNTKFDTLSYMVPPGGKTTDRYLKSTGDIVSDNLIWHIDAGNTTSYAGVTTSGTTIYDLKAGSGMNGTVGIATLASGHADFPAPGWTPDNGGAWYLASDSNLASPSNTGQFIEMPYVNLGNDNYTINAWVKLQYYSEQSDGLSYIVSNKDGSPVSYHAHIKEVGGNGRIGGGAYYTGWTYDYASSDSENTMIALNEWYMLTWVNTAQYTQSMYVNGVIQKLNGGAYTWNSRSSNNTPVNATSYASNETTNAWIGQIQYYSDTLTAAEILQNYNAHKCRYDQ